MSNLVWIIGRKATILANGHEYITEPFIAFTKEDDAIKAREMIEKISGEKAMLVTASLMSERQP